MAHADYSAHAFGSRRLPLLADPSVPAVEGVTMGWELTKIACDPASGNARGLFLDPRRESMEYAWAVPERSRLDGEVPVAFDLFILHVTQQDYTTDVQRYSDYKVFSAAHFNEPITGALGRMTGFANLRGRDVRVWRVCLAPPGAREAFEHIIPNLPASWKGARHGGLCLLHGWPDVSDEPNGRGMFRAAQIYAFMRECEGVMRMGMPGMSAKLYELFSSKAYLQMSEERLGLRVPPTASVSREECTARGPSLLAEIVERFGEPLVLKQGNTWGNQGTFMTTGVDETLSRALQIFEGTSASHVYVQKRLAGIAFEIRSVRAFSVSESRMLGSLVVMSPEDGRGDAAYTGAETITRERAVELHAAGHPEAYESMEKEVERMAARVDAFCIEFCGTLPNDCRADFLVLKQGEAGRAPAFTPYLCEMTEQNASMCGRSPMARFNAMLNSVGMMAPRPIELSW